MATNTVRINKYLSQTGICSRRGADRLIELGEVELNGRTVKDFGIQIDPLKDIIKVKGRIVRAQEKIYLMFNKPKATLTNLGGDPHDRKTIADYLENIPHKVFPVGRLDWHTEGLLLLTNDGDFANKVIKSDVPKTYIVKIEGHPLDHHIKKLTEGVTIIGGKFRFRSIEKMRRSDTKHTWYRVVMTQGINKQIQNMFLQIGYNTMKIQRVGVGCLELGNLDRGDFKVLTPEQLKKVFIDPDNRPKKKRQRSSKRDLKSDDE